MRTDPVLLERVIYNLISNAVRYTNQGVISIIAKSSGESILINISDTGCGIPEDKQQEIYEEFVQLNNPERDRSKGLGLGLSIVKRITLLLNIPFTLHSDPLIGTQVELTIPLGKEVHSVITDDKSEPVAIKLPPLFVVVIDDEVQARLAMTLLLEHWGCTVISAANAGDILVALEEYEYDPDVIIADYRLQIGQTGAQAIERICTHIGIDIAAVIITGGVEPDQLTNVNAHGYPVLNKPCNPDQLRAFLAQCNSR